MFAEICSAVECGYRGERFGEGEEDSSVYEGGYVCYENLLDDVPC